MAERVHEASRKIGQHVLGPTETCSYTLSTTQPSSSQCAVEMNATLYNYMYAGEFTSGSSVQPDLVPFSAPTQDIDRRGKD